MVLALTCALREARLDRGDRDEGVARHTSDSADAGERRVVVASISPGSAESARSAGTTHYLVWSAPKILGELHPLNTRDSLVLGD